jgi:hypothetical protein
MEIANTYQFLSMLHFDYQLSFLVPRAWNPSTTSSLLLPDTLPVVLAPARWRFSSTFVLVIACSIALAGIALSIALNISLRKERRRY